MKEMNNEIPQQTRPEHTDALTKPRNPMVFISHDTRDAEIAEAFSKLLSSVSTGVLKSFRSSERRGNQGIEYGIEWYPEIMKRLESASDVVCLLTPNSVNRPWLLYEAGVAKGKLGTSVHGVALGIPLSVAAQGPFAQFQNSDDSDKSLAQLVTQLLGRIPNSEPDPAIVLGQVQVFRAKVEELLRTSESITDPDTAESQDAVARMFEEVKVMYQELPIRIARRIEPDRLHEMRRRRSLRPRFLIDIAESTRRDGGSPIGILIISSLFRDDFPWLYELAAEAYRKLSSGRSDAREDFSQLMRCIEILMDQPIGNETLLASKRRNEEMSETLSYLKYYVERYLN